MGDAEIEAANEIYKAAKQDAMIEINRMKDEIDSIREESEALGKIKAMDCNIAFNKMLKYAALYNIKKSKEYRKGSLTWDDFCTKAVGQSVSTVDRTLKDIKPIYDNFSGKLTEFLGMPFNKIRYLGRLMSEKSGKLPDFKDGALNFDGKKIPLTPENKDDIEAAIDALKESQKTQLENKEATIKAKDRVLEAKEKIINKQEKEISKYQRQVKARGFEPGEENFIRDMENLKTMLVGVELKMDVRNMPEKMTPLMKAAYIETLGHFKRTIIAYYDEATVHYGIADDDDWVPPYEREDDHAQLEADNQVKIGTVDCGGCEFHKGMMNKAKGVKIPGNSGKCIRPGGLCFSETAARAIKVQGDADNTEYNKEQKPCGGRSWHGNSKRPKTETRTR
ncbi:MAG: hypothetical protein SWH54_09750 [Thermodesulfobacteriota bacterium]|nr:hypothetical protein [Thermodesulfobacteriota bacterium]